MGTIAPEHLSTTTATPHKGHVVIFPFMAKGHIIPLLHFADAVTRRGLKVTFLTTPSNSPFIHRHLNLPRPSIHLLHLPFPAVDPSIPPGCESTDALPSFHLFPAFLFATSHLSTAFRAALRQLTSAGDLPLCVVSDFFRGWTRPICEDEFGIPRLVFHGMGVFGMALSKSLFVHQPHRGVDKDEEFLVPGLPDRFRFRFSDVPTGIQAAAAEMNPMVKFLIEFVGEEERSWGVLVNSFADMEAGFVGLLEGFYGKETRAWLVGPLHVAGSIDFAPSPKSESVLRWLGGKAEGSVVYVSFGTQAEVSDKQLEEVCHGLLMAGQDFIWVVRSSTWAAPEGVEERLRETGKGVIVRDWAPQREVLGHRAAGGFVSHCGWNSVLEALAAGVPILAWPMMAEQAGNAKFVAEEVGVAVRVEGQEAGGGVVGRERVCEGVRELMGGEKGRKSRERVKEMRKKALSAVKEGGSSYQTLDKLIMELRGSSKMRRA